MRLDPILNTNKLSAKYPKLKIKGGSPPQKKKLLMNFKIIEKAVKTKAK